MLVSNIQLSGYKIHEEIDQMGLRVLYRATHISTGKEVYLTVISVGPGRAIETLKKRARDSQKLILEGLVTALDYGESQNRYFYYTHFAKPTLSLQNFAQNRVSDNDRLFILLGFFMETLDLVDYIHRANTTHRDLHTGQLRVDGQGNLHLEGFINARPRVESKNISSTIFLPYIAPEQLLGYPSDVKTDIYSLGVILFELVTGHLPYQSNLSKIEDARLGQVPSLTLYESDVSKELDVIVMKMLSPRNSRYRNVQEVIYDMGHFYKQRSFKLKVKDLLGSFKNLFSMRL